MTRVRMDNQDPLEYSQYSRIVANRPHLRKEIRFD
jgi:hypothetical protein